MSADHDFAARRLEYGRRTRVRRIAGSLQVATGILAVFLLFAVVGVLGSERVDNVTVLASSVLLLWFAEAALPFGSPNRSRLGSRVRYRTHAVTRSASEPPDRGSPRARSR